SATDLLGYHPETRRIMLAGATGSVAIELNELATAPGWFAGDGVNPFARDSRVTATLEFGPQPSMPFTVASVPMLIGIRPASGSAAVDEAAVITASFTRQIDLAAAGPLSLNINGTPAAATLDTSGNAAHSLVWRPDAALLPGARVEVAFPPLQDLLGQPMPISPYSFGVIGAQGITIFTDAGFTRPLVGTTANGPSIWLEVAASGPVVVPGDSRLLQIFAQRTATTPYLLPLDQADAGSRRFRGRIDLEPARAISSLTVPVVPGERLDFLSPALTAQSRFIYYRTTGDTPPLTINRLVAYTDSRFQQPLEGTDLAQTMLYLQIEADDLNWLNADTTRLIVTSDSDAAGFEILLTETAPHSGLFRATLAISPGGGASSQAAGQIAVKPGEAFTLKSVTDPHVRLQLRYQPQTRLDHLAAWPSPVRGDRLTFSFWLTGAATIEIKLFDVTGDDVAWLSKPCRAGENRIEWRIPRKTANGVYIYTLEVIPET
ncbi:MAG TPA: Ig-like domain-containing protein, partial [Candidatus Ozemobacteraceae bacterium]|nr:Ig-like domain-containing protein [Candidatus Ozemobacteraceae bacterium]